MRPNMDGERRRLDRQEPRGELAARTLAMPADTNPSGDIFGGWIMAMMDAAGSMTATRLAGGRVVTAAVSHMSFLEPVKVGDAVCCYTDVQRIGRSSLTLCVEAWALRQGQGARIQVTAAEFTFVALDEAGRPRPLTGAASDRELPGQAPASALADSPVRKEGSATPY